MNGYPLNTTMANKVVMIGLDSVGAEYLQTYPLQLPTLYVLVQQSQWIDLQTTPQDLST